MRQYVFRNITAKFDSGVAAELLLNRVRVPRCLWVVSAGNHELRFGDFRADQMKGLDHEFKAFVSAPFPERQNALVRGTAS